MTNALKLWEVTLMHEGRPIVTDGREWTEEVVAATAGKARYSVLLRVRDSYSEFRFQDVRVRSLNLRRDPEMAAGWEARLEACNDIIRIIGSHGRRFLSSNSDAGEPSDNPTFAAFKIDSCNRLLYIDRHSGREILVRLNEWRGFSDGGTLRAVVEWMRDWIMRDGFPPFIVIHEYWGYGEDAAVVTDLIDERLKSGGWRKS